MTEKESLVLKVIGERTIHCGGCENTVEFTLSKLPGVEKIKADRNNQSIEFDLIPDQTDLDKVKAELEWIGYEVEVA